MVNQVSSYNSAFVSDAMKYLQHTAVVEHKDSISEDIKSSLTMAPLIAVPSAWGAYNSAKIANGAEVKQKVKTTFGQKIGNLGQKIKNIPTSLSNLWNGIKSVPSNVSTIAHNVTDGQALTRAANVFKSGDGVLYLDDLSSAITNAKKAGRNADELISLRNTLTKAIQNGEKTDDIIKSVDKALKETAQTAGKKGLFSKIGGLVSKPFKWLGGKITTSGAYNAIKSTEKGAAAISKLGNFAKVAKKSGAIFDLVIEGGMQLFGEIIPAFKNGGIDSGIKQIGKSGLQVAGSVGGWALGASLGTKAGAAIGTAICPGIGTAAGAVIGAVGGIVGGLLGSSLFSGIAKKITGKSENEIIQEEQLEQQANMLANDSNTVAQLQSAVAQQVQYDIQSGNVTEDTEKMAEYLQNIQTSTTTQPSFGSLTTNQSWIATNPDGTYDFSVPQDALLQMDYTLGATANNQEEQTQLI